jgi:hypothetical protein
MYMSGKLAIDPNLLATTRRKPTKGFRRFAEILTAGLIAEREVHQTFSALSILQEINGVLRSLGITDVVRFTKDNTVIYEDPDSHDTDDMRLVLDRVSQDSRSRSSSIFQTMSLLLEHHLPEITLVIEVRIRRTHAIGEDPIQIIVNGLAAAFSQQEKDTAAVNLDRSFEDQLGYNAFSDHFRDQFDDFMQELEDAVRRHMRVDQVRRRLEAKIVRPQQDQSTVAAFGSRGDSPSSASRGSDPVFQRYDATSDAFAYCWIWSTMMNSHDIRHQDVTIVDERGGAVGMIDGEGQAHDAIDRADSAFTDSDDANRNIVDTDTDAGLSGWLSSFGGFGDSDSGGDSTCGGSSCGGSSCGGGCGGD